MALENKIRTQTEIYFYKLSKVSYVLCAAPYYWFEDLNLTKIQIKFYDVLSKFIHIFIYVFILFEWGAFFTQNNLTEKQSSDRALFSISHPIVHSFVTTLVYHKDKVRVLSQTLIIQLKEIYNDVEVDRQMVRKAKSYAVIAHSCLYGMTVLFYGINGLAGTTFTTVIPAWPDVEDRSTVAGFSRVLFYIIWFIAMARVATVYTIMLSLTICLSHQYKHLQRYFYGLSNIFDTEKSQREKEEEYETAFKLGIKLHSSTMWCTKEIQAICGVVFGGQIIMNTTVFILLMSQIVSSDKTITNLAAAAVTMMALLISTGFFMWNAGDVTVEAANLPKAIFNSGWQHCQHGASMRIRPLLVIAISMSQQPVELKCLGIVRLSYSAYVSIVKSAYSAFSVFY